MNLTKSALAFVTALGLCIAVAGLAHGQGTFDLTREDVGHGGPFNAGEFYYSWASDFAQLDEAPEGLAAQVTALGDDVLFFGVDLGGREVLMAVGRQDWPLLLVDSNGDGKLSDQEPVRATSKGQANWINGTQCMFPSQTIHDPDVDPYPFTFSLRCMIPGEGPAFLTLVPQVAFTGTAKLGGVEYAIAVIDTTLDGHFKNTHPGPPCDRLVVDLNHDGRFRRWAELIALPKLTRIGGALYSVSVADDNSTITFAEADGPVGTLQTPAPFLDATATSPDGVFQLEPGTAAWTLPPGEFEISRCMIFMTDAAGHEWKTYFLKRGENPPFTIRADETTELKIGPPFRLVAHVHRDGPNVLVNYSVFGQGGREFSARPRSAEGSVDPATIRIVDEKGTELESGTFEYG